MKASTEVVLSRALVVAKQSGESPTVTLRFISGSVYHNFVVEEVLDGGVFGKYKDGQSAIVFFTALETMEFE